MAAEIARTRALRSDRDATRAGGRRRSAPLSGRSADLRRGLRPAPGVLRKPGNSSAVQPCRRTPTTPCGATTPERDRSPTWCAPSWPRRCNLGDSESIDPGASLIDLGLDSLLALDLRRRLRRAVGYSAPVAAMLGGITVNELIDVLRAGSTDGQDMRKVGIHA